MSGSPGCSRGCIASWTVRLDTFWGSSGIEVSVTVWRSATVSEQTAITATSRPGLWMVAMLIPDVVPITTEDAVFTALARFVLGHDLVTQCVFKHFPPDHPLRWQLADLDAAEVSHDEDRLWVRLLDVARALIARGWFMDGELVLDVDDPFLGELNRYLLTVRGGKADCVPTDREPDLSLDVSDLGSVYLGGTAPSTLVRAGHIRAHHQCAAALADALFRTERAPHCLHWF